MRNNHFQVCAPSEVLLRCHPVRRTGGESPLGAQATGLCSASTQSNRAPLPPVAVYNLFVSSLAPDDVFVISPIDKCVDFSVLIITKQDSAFDTFAKEKLRCFRK
jgi:hypothetical protein